MKKLMIAAAIVCAAAMAQAAASINWNVQGVTPTSGSSIPASTYWTYCFISSDTSENMNPTFTTQQVVDWILAGTDPYEMGVENGNYAGSGQAVASGTYDATGASDVAPIYMHAWAVITDASDVADVAHYQIVDCGMVEFTGANQALPAPGTASASGWVAVPEPTSGLLLLLGVAGLALRRRRA